MAPQSHPHPNPQHLERLPSRAKGMDSADTIDDLEVRRLSRDGRGVL